jgi:hypothetical protein
MKRATRFLSVFLFMTVMLSLIVPPAAAVSGFSDTKNHWAKEYINEGVKAGYISGYGDGTFRPDSTVTRGAFCKILNKALGLQATASVSFSDVKSSDPFYAEIQKAVYAGYISGYTDNTFRASTTINRQQAAVMLSRILTNASTQSASPKDSSSIANYAKAGVRKVMSKGYISGDKSGRFNPTSPMTRAQTAKVISQVLDGEKVVNNSVTFTTSGKTYSNDIYVGPLSVEVPTAGNITYQNCQILGTLFVKSGTTVNLKNCNVVSLSVSGQNATVNATGTTSVSNTYLSNGANLTESGLSGSGFNTVSLSGSNLKNSAVSLRGAFSSVDVSSPAKVNLLSGSMTALKVNNGAAGSTFALNSGSTVTTATMNANCAFTGKGIIGTAVQNVSGVTYETQPNSINGTTSGTLTPTSITPSNDSSGISVGTTIKLQFSETLNNSGGGTLTASNVASNVVQLRRNSESGSTVPFSVSVSSDRRTITITPTYSLDGNSTYYVVLLAGGLKNAAGTQNSRQVYHFSTTNSTLAPTSITPSNNSSDVDVSSNIVLRFSETLYNSSKGTLTAGNISSNVIELRAGSSSGSKISYSASINSSRNMITIDPSSDLSPNTTYYVILLSSGLRNYNGDYNSSQTYSFTTAGGTLVPTITPSSGSTGVALDTSIKLQFSEALYDSNRYALASGDINQNVIELYDRDNSTRVSYSATVSSDKKLITLKPTNPLTAGTSYYVRLIASRLRNSSGDYNSKQTYYFTTLGGSLVPSISPSNEATGVSVSTSITLTFPEKIYNSKFDSLGEGDISGIVQLRTGSATGSAVTCTYSVGSRTITLYPKSSLANNTTYFVVITEKKLRNTAGEYNARMSYYFKTAGTVTPTVSLSGTSNIPVDGPIMLRFNQNIYQSNGTTVPTEANIKNAVTLHRADNNTSIGYSASVSGSTITITPTAALERSTSYTVSIAANKFYSSAKQAVPAANLSFTTQAPSLNIDNISDADIQADSVTLHITSAAAGDATINVVGGSDTKAVSTQLTANTKTPVVISDLTPNTTYTVYAVMPSGSLISQQRAFTTVAPKVTIADIPTQTLGTTSVNATVSTNCKGRVVYSCTGDVVPPAASEFSGAGTATVTLSIPNPGSYELMAKLYRGDDLTNAVATASMIVSIPAPSTRTDLGSLTILRGTETIARIDTFTGNDASTGTDTIFGTLSLTVGDQLTFQAEAMAGIEATVTSVSSTLSDNKVPSEGTNQSFCVTVAVTAQDHHTVAEHHITIYYNAVASGSSGT